MIRCGVFYMGVSRPVVLERLGIILMDQYSRIILRFAGEWVDPGMEKGPFITRNEGNATGFGKKH